LPSDYVTHPADVTAYEQVPLLTQVLPFDVQVDKAAVHSASVANAKSSQILLLHLTESIVHPGRYVLQAAASAVSDGALSHVLVIQLPVALTQ
jgi:hypothetical protein